MIDVLVVLLAVGLGSSVGMYLGVLLTPQAERFADWLYEFLND